MKKNLLMVTGLLISGMTLAQNGGNSMKSMKTNCHRKAEEMCR